MPRIFALDRCCWHLSNSQRSKIGRCACFYKQAFISWFFRQQRFWSLFHSIICLIGWVHLFHNKLSAWSSSNIVLLLLCVVHFYGKFFFFQLTQSCTLRKFSICCVWIRPWQEIRLFHYFSFMSGVPAMIARLSTEAKRFQLDNLPNVLTYGITRNGSRLSIAPRLPYILQA